MNTAERIKHLRQRLQTRAGPGELGQLVFALARLGVFAVVVKDAAGGLSLATVTMEAIGENVGTMRLDRLRTLTQTEANVAREYGAGYFEAPRPVEPTPDENVQG